LEYFEAGAPSSLNNIFTKHLVDSKGSPLEKEFEFYDDWYIEDPATKGLVKSVSYTLAPGENYTFIVVLKSPVVRKTRMYLANVFINQEGRDLCREDQLNVFCFGAMEIPKMVCPKEIYNAELDYSSIKVMMRRTQPYLPIKVLFANNGNLPIECQFVNIDWGPEIKFTIPRDKIHIEPKQRSLLDIKASLNLDKAAQDNGESFTIHKLLVGKVTECEFKFRLIIEVTVI